jgi:hypothetical protein
MSLLDEAIGLNKLIWMDGMAVYFVRMLNP